MFSISMSSTTLLPQRLSYQNKAVIVDIGTFSIKVGRAENGTEILEFPPYILRGNKRTVGKDAIKAVKHRGINADLRTPFRDGKIEDWDGLKIIWETIFKHKLFLELNRTPIVMCEPVKSGDQESYRQQRVEVAKTFFEDHDVPAYYVAPQPVFCLHRFGIQTGVVIDVGHSHTRVSVVFNGNTIPQCTKVSPIAGKVFDDLLYKQLVGKGLNEHDRFLMHQIKAEFCFVSNHIDEDKEKLLSGNMSFMERLQKQVILEDGAQVPIDEERFLVPETLFNPTDSGSGYTLEESLIEIVKRAKHSYETYRQEQARRNPNFQGMDATLVFRKFIIVGGSTKMPGMVERIMSEVSNLMIDYELENSGFDPNQMHRNETRNEIRQRLSMSYYYEQDAEDRGKESYHGAVGFTQDVDNRAWVSDVHIEDNGYDILVDQCPK